jgi:hypothetical protein
MDFIVRYLNIFMKAILLSLLLVIKCLNAMSQCDKKMTWYASKGEMYDTNGTLLDTKLDSIFIETDPQKVSVRFKADENSLEGTVKDKICDWKEPFRNGKTVYHTDVSIDGTSGNATFTVEARNGKITLTVVVEARADKKYLIYIDRYVEVK